MHPSREQIATVIESTVLMRHGAVPSPRAERAADAVLALLQPHTITTEDELVSVPADSIVRDAKGRVWRTYADGDHDCLDIIGSPPSAIPLPALVLWVPEVTG